MQSTVSIIKNGGGALVAPEFKTAEEAINYIKRIDEEGFFRPAGYDVRTPINSCGHILFDDNLQHLTVQTSGVLYIGSAHGANIEDHRDQFMWVPCKPSDLKPGDTAYRSNRRYPDFGDTYQVCCIVDGLSYWHITADHDIRKSGADWQYWFKLTRR